MKFKKKYLAYLIGEDETILQLIQVRLEKLAYIEIICFNDIYKALESSTENLDFIIFDDSIEFNKALSSISFFKEDVPEVKVIALSDQQDIQLFERALNLGVDRFYSKNIVDFDLLEEYVKSVLTSTKNSWFKNKINSLQPKKTKKEKTIYILDDSSLTSSTIDYSLTRNSSDIVYSFETIEKFKESFVVQKPDILVLDYYLNDKQNGMDVLIEVKKESPSTIVLMMSSQQDIKVASNLLLNGATRYFIKSKYNIEKLAEYISQLEITIKNNIYFS